MIKVYMKDETSEGQSFDFQKDIIYVGRLPDNDVQIRDKSVSRKHLKIMKRDDRYFIEDLESKNGTFVHGDQVIPDVEFEIEEGIPILVGMSVVCLGKACLENVMPFLDSLSEDAELFIQDRPMTSEKNMELINRVSRLLMQSADISDVLKKILDSILELLTRIDRGVIILTDDKTGKILDVIIRSKKGSNKTVRFFSRTVVKRVMMERKAIMMRDTRDESKVDASSSMKLMNVQSVMCVPLVSKSRVRGVIYVDSVSAPHGFRTEDLSLLTALSSPAAIAIENAALYSEYLEEKRS
jgi:hypothetical protein